MTWTKIKLLCLQKNNIVANMLYICARCINDSDYVTVDHLKFKSTEDMKDTPVKNLGLHFWRRAQNERLNTPL